MNINFLLLVIPQVIIQNYTDQMCITLKTLTNKTD